MATNQEDHATAVLTALALVEARLDGRDADLTTLMDGCNNRAVATVLADMYAQQLTVLCGDNTDPHKFLADFRADLLDCYPPTQPPAQG